ncbi:hypothetical protein [Butyrivibrio sp.]|uniref:hypothetical protein n=1 Tax=Butyrivibrio sp. TaxID=28121 RepID=UPI0025C6DDFC|nr:hypothetical protein [Butyrivibrio sp.]MBQ7431334.1 hypothetical protein [Butyrivibrio sp.]MBQ9302726.1 hypothetical protein [Butyrivibrio sp.]
MQETVINKNNLISVIKAAKSLGIKTDVLLYQIDAGNLNVENGMLFGSECGRISAQQEMYIGIRAFLKAHDNKRFVSRYAKNRNKYIDFLEDNAYFGIEIVEPEYILFELPEREDFYVTKEDAQLLEYKSEQFFREFGFTEEEKVRHIINRAKRHLVSAEYMKKYLEYIEDEENIYTPALTAFVRTVFDMSDIGQLTDEDIVSAVEETDAVRTKSLLVDFFAFVAKYENVKYHNIELKKKEADPDPAYAYEDFIKIAKILFNKEYDEQHDLTLKALDNSKYAELWMYLACHYICGWRSSDICERWIYPDLKDSNNPFKINTDTLREDIANGSIKDETYDKVALYSIKKIEMVYNMPQKTGVGKLRSEIVPELRTFFGKLILIAEYHHMTDGEGYMNSHRAGMYRSWIVCRDFFGDDIFTVTGKHSLSSRRLNKSYLQGIEQSALDNGSTTLQAHVVASFARNHSNIDTTAAYLKDHGLTGESAEIVLYMMMQRGVFSVSLYNALIAAYPDAFEKLSAKEQTAIMEKIPLSAYELETVGTSMMASGKMADVFAEGKTEEPIEILKAMYAIAQGKGKAKDTGIYCKRKALGVCCENPTYESCLANLCPYHVFTSDGVPALIKVIKDYQQKELITGNRKYGVALKTKIIPAFQDIINAIIKEMSEEERSGTKRLIEDALNG